MKTVIAFAACLLAIIPATARAQLSVKADARGVTSVHVGDVLYLTDLAVSVVKPGWTGDLADQRAVDPGSVKVLVSGTTTTYAMPLAGGSMTGVLIERIRREADGVSLEFEVIPDEEAELEAVVLRGSLATSAHAGKTKYQAGDPLGNLSLLPPTLDVDRFRLWAGKPNWIALAAPGGGRLRVEPGGSPVLLQDDRRWNADRFSLMVMASGGEVLARKPIQTSIRLRSETAAKPTVPAP